MSDSLMSNMALDDQEIKPIIDNSTLIGGVYYMDYDECVIVSNDRWKDTAGGVPRHCFLLATAANWQDPDDFNEDDAYAILLRAEGPAKLPTEEDLMEVRAEAMRKKVTDNSGNEPLAVPGSSEDVMDVLTRNEIQFSGINAKILGTVYQEDNEIKFGSDVDTFYSSARYEVYKPGPEALAKILDVQISRDDEDEDEEDGIRLGRVRYSSTERTSNFEDAHVPIRIKDIIGNKTALFGMTRTGNSNTMKMVATTVFEYAVKNDKNIGQLLFDPAGEYANVNKQDEETALSELHSDVVTVYSWGESKEENTEPLQIDFFNYQLIDAVWSTIKLLLTRDADYVTSFKQANVVGPDNPSENYGEYNRAMRRRAALYGTLLRAGFKPENEQEWPIPTNKDVRAILNGYLDDQGSDLEYDGDSQGRVWVGEGDIHQFWEAVLAKKDDINALSDNDDPDDKPWVDEQLEAILDVYTQKKGSGYRILEDLKKYHQAGVDEYYPDQIYKKLTEGEIVIVDLTTMGDQTSQRISKTIIDTVVKEAVNRFTAGKEPYNIQIYVEEAHRLFGSDYLDDADEDDPYRRLAKEAAKYKIGLTYATQEVSEVDNAVLANTANWIVTHLNSKNETKELSKYYNFEDFEWLTREAEDVGFARVKTLSGKFIVPTQIDKFDEDRVDRARELYLRETESDTFISDY